MTPTNTPHLCGGIFFGLLLEARKPRSKARNKMNGGSDCLSATDVYNGLVELVTGEAITSIGRTNSKCVSNYKSCVSSKGAYVPFTDPIVQSAFNSMYCSKDTNLLSRTVEFIEKYLSASKCVWLVHALIDTMQQEKLNREIAINFTETLKVSELQTADSILFVPFFLCILHYVITECPDCESGRSTFESWYSQSTPRAEWKFKSDIGSKIHHINVSMDVDVLFADASQNNAAFTTSEVSATSDVLGEQKIIAESLSKSLSPFIDALEAQKSELQSPEALMQSIAKIAETAESYEKTIAEKIKEPEKNQQTNESTGENIIHQTVVNQYGDHPVHIDHVENLKL